MLTCLLALALFLGACSDPRNDVRTELFRLDEAMQRHAAQYGRFPETLDPRRPAGRTNLPYTPESEVDMRLLGVTENRYGAAARRKSWVCVMSAGPGQKAQPKCTPTGGSSRDLPDTIGQPAPVLEGVLSEPSAPPADSSLPSRSPP